MDVALRTIAGIVRLRSASRTRRAIRPEPPRSAPLPASPSNTPPGGRRRFRPSWRSAVAVGLVAVLVAAAATALVLTMPSIERSPASQLTNDPTPLLSIEVAHPGSLSAGQVDARVDGERISERRIDVSGDSRSIEVAVPPLEDGIHEVRLQVEGAGLLRTTLDASWKLEVDTVAPAARVVGPRPVASPNAYVAAGVVPVTRLPLALTVAAEPGSTIDVRSNAAGAKPARAKSSEAPRRTLDVQLPEGPQLLAVTATDPAGNETLRRVRVLVDTSGPVLSVRAPRIVRDAALSLPIAARDPHGVDLEVKLDGRVLEDGIVEQSLTPAPNAGSGDEAPAGGDPVGGSDEPTGGCADDEGGCAAASVDLPIAGSWKVSHEDGAFEGRHTLEVVATDSLGTRTATRRTFTIDSSEDLGAVSGLKGGARGADVAQLHQALVQQEVVTRAQLAADMRSRSYGGQTRAAVMKFQQSRGMDADGVAGADTIAGLTLKIVVDRGAHTLTLYRVGKVVRTFGVAVGSPQYPTPAGDFEIQTMQMNPTWTPPDSDWAKDAEVIPPGPDNPLGTRWMAIDGTVGIHGTNSPASIGYSVSHGCIRMAIPDVEALYDMVAIGTPVTVV